MKQGPLHAVHESANAVFTDINGWSLPAHYGDTPANEEQQARAGAGLIDLCSTATIVLEGPDARRFCNGMFTNNIRGLEPGEGNRSAMCDDRGRVQGLLDIYCTGPDRFEGVLEGVEADWFEGRYEMYIVFDDVEMSVSAEAPWLLSVQGPEAAKVLSAAGLPTPEQAGHHMTSDSGIRVMNKDRTGLGGFDLLISADVIVETCAALRTAGASPLGHQAFDAIRISHGRAQWPVDGNEKSLVHELAINEEVCDFNKGCYLGQEVINRIDVKGQVAKRLTKIILDGDGLPPKGAEVLFEDQAVGTVTSAAHSCGQTLALAVLRKKAWGPGQALVIQSTDGTWTGQITPTSG
jgi:folate-binding protein YgfZ